MKIGRSKREWPVTPASLVIQKFGGLSAFALAIGKGVSTVQRWLDTGFVPSRNQAEVLAAARRVGIDLDPATFVPVPIEQADAA